MAKSSRKPKKKNQGSRKVPRGGPKTPIDSSGGNAPSSTDPDKADELFVAQWQSTRSGAWAGRGFHFQDAVGAWLAAGIAEGSIANAQLVPEGLEDMTLERAQPLQIQVKSRIGYLGPFPHGRASKHILDAWDRLAIGGESAHRLCVVLEGGIRGHPNLHDLNQPLDQTLPVNSPMRDALTKRARDRGLDNNEVSRLMATTAVVGMDWESVTAQTINHLETLTDLPPSARAYVARELRIMVAEAADTNARAEYSVRRVLSRTELVSAIDRLATHMDLDALESAVVDGICEPFELGEPTSGEDRYYEGLATQPEHVAAGLVVPRPEVMAEVVSGLQDRSAVVLTGPSGIGKSAVLWMVPMALPGVLWYRIRRLADEDVPALIRLARAYAVSPKTPVGFLVDAAGTGDFRGWARLRAEAAAVPGTLLVGAARIEDLATLGDLSDCLTISVSLNEKAAEVIHSGLARRGATTAPHWREAFEQSAGLTLEYTHLLTRGRRLDDVIAEQIRVRIEEERHREIELLSLVSTADRWLALITLDDVAAEMGVDRLELRKAVGRLAKEHLLVEKNGVLSGLHQLRSVAINKAVHNPPPPDLASTVQRTLDLIPASHLHRFVVNLLRDEERLADAVIDTASGESLDLLRVVGYLHGLRLSDFYAKAKAWKSIADRRGVPPSSQALLFSFAAADLEFPDIFPEQLRSAQHEMAQAIGTSSRDKLVAQLGTDTLARMLANTERTSEAASLLSTLDAIGRGLTTSVARHLDRDSSLASALHVASLTEVGECLAAARACDHNLADLLVMSIGGEAEMLARIRRENPWVTELDIHEEGDTTIGYARILHVSDELQGDPREQAISLGRLLLRCIPEIDSVDVQSRLPGDQEIRLGDYTHGTSGLQRRYDRTMLTTAWNQASFRAAYTLVADTDTARLADALPLIGEASAITREMGTMIVTGNSNRTDIQILDTRIAELHRRANLLRPPLGSIELGDTELGQETAVPFNDDLSALLTDLTGNVYPRLGDRDGYRALAAYLSNTVRGRHLPGVHREPWRLLGIEGHPESLDDLSAALADLNVVVEALASGSANERQILGSARAGTRARALHRAADTCRQAMRRGLKARHQEIAKTCGATGLRIRVFGPIHADGPRGTNEPAITVELASLIDWGDATSMLQDALNRDKATGDTFTLIPIREGRPVPSMTMRLISRLWPAPGLGGRESELRPAHPSELADTLEAASAALQKLSGISHLDPTQQAHNDVQVAADEAAVEYRSARERLEGFPADTLTQELLAIVDSLAVRVQEELDGAASGPSFAERVVAGALEVEDTEEFNTLVGGRVLALEWDIDRAKALQLFHDVTSDP